MNLQLKESVMLCCEFLKVHPSCNYGTYEVSFRIPFQLSSVLLVASLIIYWETHEEFGSHRVIMLAWLPTAIPLSSYFFFVKKYNVTPSNLHPIEVFDTVMRPCNAL